MLGKRLREAWRTRERATPIQPSMMFSLGAGTILLRSDGARRLQTLRGQEARILALLSAAYGEAVTPTVLGNIERAEKCWRRGDDCLAHIHLAHSGLHAPSDIRAAACRLFLADTAMNMGLSPFAVFQALKIDGSYIDAIDKVYNPAEPRVPAGSGRSGEWTDGDSTNEGNATKQPAAGGLSGSSLVARLSPPVSSFLDEIVVDVVSRNSVRGHESIGTHI